MEKQNFGIWMLCFICLGHHFGFCDMCKQLAEDNKKYFICESGKTKWYSGGKQIEEE